jgi:hypothetical protein
MLRAHACCGAGVSIDRPRIIDVMGIDAMSASCNGCLCLVGYVAPGERIGACPDLVSMMQ